MTPATPAPRGPRSRLALVGVLVALASLVAVAALAGPGSADRERKAGLKLTQKGSVTGLYPGQRTTVTVVVRNTSPRPIKLRSVSARTRSVGGCSASMLRVGKVASKKTLKPRRTTTVRLGVELLRAAPDACQGRTFRLDLKAVGRPVR